MREVDERVVQMRLETGAFERVAQITIGTLNKIKDALNIGTASKAFDDINASATKTSGLDKMASAVDMVSNRFSNLGIIGVTAIQNITNRAINAGTEMLKSLTIAPISQGFDEYELKMGAVQTIMASTGAPLEEINGYLDELNTYADRTIYSFSDMTQNIGKFTNAGVDLEKAVKAIQGISNAAALSGSNAQQASHAMYNFAQAISSGSVKLIDWKSIELAGMATVEFKQTLIDTALELGTVVKEGNKYVSTTTDMKGKVSEAFDATQMFNDSLSHQWMTTDVLVATLNKYSDETTDLGKRAFAAAQDVKTFSQLMDTLKEAVGSGWAQTFELIFGDFNEAKELWTAVSNTVGGFIDNVSKARNEMLQFWHDNGGRTKAFEGFANIVKGFASVVKPLSDAWSALIPKVTGQDLVRLSERFAEVTSHMKLSENAAKGLNGIAKVLLVPVRGLIEAAKIGAKILGKTIGLVGRFADGVLSLIGIFVKAAESAYNWITGLEIWDKVFSKIQEGVELLSDGFGYLGDSWNRIVKAFEETEFAKGVLKGIDKIQNKLSEFKDFLKKKLTGALEKIANIDFGSIGNDLLEMAESAGKFIISFKDLPIVQDAVDGIKSSFKKATKWVKEFLTAAWELSGDVLDTIKEKFSKIQNLEFGDIKREFEKATERIREYAASLDGLSFGEKVIKINQDVLKGLGGAFKWAIEKVSDAKMAIIDFFTALSKKAIEHGFLDEGSILGNMIKFMSTITDSIKEFVSNLDVGEKLKEFGDNLWDFAVNVKKALEKLEPSTVLLFIFGAAVTAFVAVLSYLGVKMGKMFGAIGELSESLSTFIKMFRKQKGVEAKIKALSLSILMITASITILALLPTDKLIQSAVAIGLVLGVLGAVAVAITTIAKKNKSFLGSFNKFAQGVLMISSGILALAAAFKLLEGERFGWNTMERLLILANIAVMLGGVGIIMSRYGKDLAKGSLFFLAFALSIAGVVKSFSMLKGMDVQALREGSFYVMRLMATFALLAYAAKDLKFGSAIGMTLMLLNIRILGSVVKSLIKMKPDLKDGLSIVPAALSILVGMGAIMAITRLAGPNAVKGALSVVLLSLFFDRLMETVRKLGEIKQEFGLNRIEELLDGMFMILGGLSLLMASTFAVGKRAIRGAIAVSIISASTLLLATFIEKIAKIKQDDVNKAGKVLIGIGIAAAAMMLIMRSLSKVDPKSISKVTAALGVLFMGIAIMSFLDVSKIMSSTLGLSAVLVSLGYLMKSFGNMKIEKGLKKFFLMAGVMATSAFILNRMAKNTDWSGLIAAGASLSAVILALTVAANFAKKANREIGSLTLLAVASIIPASILAGLSFFDWKGMIAGAVSLGILMNALAKVTTTAKTIKASTVGSLTLLALSALAAAVPLMILSSFDWKGMIGAAVSLGILMNALALATKLAKDNVGGAASITIMSLGLVAAAYALSKLASVSSNALIAGVIALGLAITILGVAGNALKGVDVHILLITGALAVFAGAAWIFAQAIDTVCSALIRFKDVSREQAENIGTAFAVILLSFTITLIKGLPEVVKAVYWSAQQIALGFIKGLLDFAQPIIDIAKFLFSIPYGIITKIWDINSPSKIAKLLASFIGEGFEQGLYNSIFGVEDASLALGSSSMEGLSEGAESASSGMSGLFSGLFESFAGDFNAYGIGSEQGSLLGEGFASGFNLDSVLGDIDISSYFDHAFDGISDLFKEGGLSANLGLEDGLSNLPNTISQIPSQLQDSISSIDLYGEGFDLTSVLSNGMEGGLSNLEPLKDLVQNDFFGSFDLESIFNSGFTVGGTFKDGIFSAFKSGDDGPSGILDSYQNDKRFEGSGAAVLNKFQKGFEKGYLNHKNSLQKKADEINTTLTNRLIGKDSQKRFVMSGTMLSVDFVNGFLNAKGNATNAADQVSNETANEVGGPKAQNKYKKAGSENIEALAAGMTLKGKSAINVAADLAIGMNKKFQVKESEYGDSGIRSVEYFGNGMKTKGSAVEKTAETLAANARNRFTQKEGDYTSSAIRSANNYRTGLSNQTQSVLSTATNVAQNAVYGISSRNGQFYTSGINGSSSFANGIKSLVGSSYNAGYSLGTSASSGMSYGLSNATSVGINAAQGLINGLNSKQREVSNAAAALSNAAAAAMQAALNIHSPSKVTEKIGNQGAQGLINGTEKTINNATKTLTNAGSKLGSSINTGISQGAKKTTNSISKAGSAMGHSFTKGLIQELAIHSPSKETENIAYFTAEGFINGIQNATDSVSNSAEQMGDAAINGLKTAVSSAVDVITSEDMTPVISPVVDLSNVMSSVDDINNLMNANTPKIVLDKFTLDSVQATAMSMKGRSRSNLMSDISGAQNDNSDVVRAIKELGEQMWTIRDAISGMQVMMNSSALVGQILPGVDKGLNARKKIAQRGG